MQDIGVPQVVMTEKGTAAAAATTTTTTRFCLILWEAHPRATKRHLPYGITQCSLPPNTGERALP